MKRAPIMALLFFFGLVCDSAHASAMESYHYVETIGEIGKDIQWCVDKSEPARLLYQSKEETHITRTDEFYATTQWEMEKIDEDTLLHARRTPRAIIIQGQWKGHQISKELSIDDAPWYQATSWSLRAFILSSREEIRFWTVRVDTLEVHKIKAVKRRQTVLNLNGVKEEAVKVELRLTGLLAPFWKSSYWFRQSDGVFLRFEGPSGPPGAPTLLVEFRGQAAPCELGPLEPRISRSKEGF